MIGMYYELPEKEMKVEGLYGPDNLMKFPFQGMVAPSRGDLRSRSVSDCVLVALQEGLMKRAAKTER